MKSENKPTRPNWSDLPSDVQLKIIRDGIEKTSSGKEAARFLRNLGSVNQFLRQFIKDNSIFLIRLISTRYYLPMRTIAFYLGPLSKEEYLKSTPEISRSLPISQESDSNENSLGMAIPYSVCDIRYPSYSSKYSPNRIPSVWHVGSQEKENHSIGSGSIYEETEDEIRERDEKYCQEEMQKSLLDFVLAGDYDNVLGLLENKTNPNCMNNNGYTPLYMAICEGHPKIAELLLSNKANPNQKDDIGCTPLIWASIKDMKSLVDCLIQNGALLNEVDDFGLTALTKACLNGNYEIMEILLSSGANSQIRDNVGQTVYDHAIIEGNDKIITLLTEKGNGVHMLKGKEKVHIKSLSKSDGALLNTKESEIISLDDFWDFGEEEKEENYQKSKEWTKQISTLISSYDLTHLLALNDTLDKNLSDRTNKIKDLIQDRIRTILQI